MVRNDKLVYKVGERIYRLNPPLFRIMQNQYNKIVADKKWKSQNPNIAPPLTKLNIELTIVCNLRCPFCWWWGENGIAPSLIKNGDQMFSKQLTTQEIMGIVDQAQKLGVKDLYLAGAEPFTRTDTLELIKYMVGKGMFVSTTTNGTLIKDEVLKELATIKKLSLGFSLDGTRDVHDKIRGRGMFDKTITTINKLAEYRGKDRFPAIKTNTTFSPWLLGHTMELADFLQEQKLSAMHFQHLWFTNRERADAHKKFLKANFGVDDNGVDAHVLTMPTQMYAEQLANEISQLEKKRFKVPLFIKPHMKKEQIMKYYTDLNFTLRKNCVAPWGEHVLLKVNGDLVYCPDEWVTHSVGNIRKETLEQIWTGDKSKQFRTVLNKVGLFPACARCCIIN